MEASRDHVAVAAPHGSRGAPIAAGGKTMSNSLTLAQCESLQEIKRVIDSIILKLIDRRWTDFVKERATPPGPPARH
jgi:hypothetical protein